MKTIFIIVSGVADYPDVELDGKTPLMLARTPSLDALARCGCCGNMKVLPDEVPFSRTGALLSLLGYDMRKQLPDEREIAAFGLSSSAVSPDPGPGYFVIPKFSGHGVVISSQPVVRGIGKMMLLKTIDLIIGENDVGKALRAKADAAVKAIGEHEFVLLQVESAAAMARRGDIKGKIEAIERIDSDIITPVADYVWNAKEQMNMVVACDCITSWRTRRNERGDVPAVVYFNDDLPYDTPAFDELTAADGPLNTPLPGDLIRKLITFEPVIDETPDSL